MVVLSPAFSLLFPTNFSCQCDDFGLGYFFGKNCIEKRLVLHLVLNFMDAKYFYITIRTICFLCFLYIYVKENMGAS